MEQNETDIPAFPHNDWAYKGMTLRDWFAGQAMAGTKYANCGNIAERAYRLADSMLAEREKVATREIPSLVRPGPEDLPDPYLKECKKCGHSWSARGPLRPGACPSCVSEYWDEQYKGAK